MLLYTHIYTQIHPGLHPFCLFKCHSNWKCPCLLLLYVATWKSSQSPLWDTWQSIPHLLPHLTITPAGLLWQVSVGSPHSNKEREGKSGQVTLCMLGSVPNSTEKQDRAAGRSRRLGWNLRALSFWGVHLISKPQFLHLKMKMVMIPTSQASCRTAWDGPHGALHIVSKTQHPVSSSSPHLCPQKGGYEGT